VVRYIHVGFSKLHDDEVYQLDLFEDNTKERELGYVMDKIRNKFGSTAIVRARSLTEGGTVLTRSFHWGAQGMIQDRGRIKWTSLYLPEHKKMFAKMYEEENDQVKPVIDEQRMEELQEVAVAAIYGNRSLK
jgi:hypothetical protein